MTNNDHVYTETTRGITVSVQPIYLEDQSVPDENHYVWAYRVNIRNDSDDTVQLLTRYWRITDSLGHVQEVRGDGVVGEQPVLEPGDSFEYTSGTPLSTSNGIMAGSFHMHSGSGENFDVTVPAFSLDSPHHTAAVH